MLSIKNNNLYYYNYRVLNGELSTLLIPLSILLIIKYNNLIKFASQIFIMVFIIGSINAYLISEKYNLLSLLFLGILIHVPTLYPLIDCKKYFEPNIIQYMLGIIGILICMFLPYWPYLLSRRKYNNYYTFNLFFYIHFI